jgi:hypothetical protein
LEECFLSITERLFQQRNRRAGVGNHARPWFVWFEPAISMAHLAAMPRWPEINLGGKAYPVGITSSSYFEI